MIVITHLNKNKVPVFFDGSNISPVYIFVLQRLAHTLECGLPLIGENDKYDWLFEVTHSSYICTIKDKS
tara:strand:+ start:67 stop:273 length:207 start_codon:yes stop_codon:yes gene_type:complete